MTEADSLQAAIRATVHKFGRLDVLRAVSGGVAIGRKPSPKHRHGQADDPDPAAAILEILAEARESEFVFPGGKKGRPLSNMAMLKLLQRMERSHLTVHGFRSTFSDWCGETTDYPRDVVEMALAHTIGDKVEAAYRRGDLFEKRRQLMTGWAILLFDRKPDLYCRGVNAFNGDQKSNFLRY